MILAWLLLIAGLVISAVAIYYSVVGLTAIFAAAMIPIIIMGSALEVGKLVCASWLKANWSRAPKYMKYYMITAVAVLMLITSMGIFGFLSKAHNDQNLVSGDVQSKIAIYDEKIKTARENIEAARKQLKQMDEAVDQVMARSTSEEGAAKANNIRRSQQRDRIALAKEIETNQKLITSLNDESAPIRAEIRKVEAEVGPIKYIAKFIYGEQGADVNMLEKAVTWIIILIVIVFDPLAVIMLLAAQMTFGWYKEEKQFEQELEKKRTVAKALDDKADIPYPTTGFVAQEVASVVPEAVWQEETANMAKSEFDQRIWEQSLENLQKEKEQEQGKYEPLYCYKCNTELVNAPGIGYFCPNKSCDVLDGPFSEDEEPVVLEHKDFDQRMWEKSLEQMKESAPAVTEQEEIKPVKKTRVKRNTQREQEQSALLTKFIEESNVVKTDERPGDYLPSNTVKREGSQDDLDNKYQEMVQELQPEKQSKYRRKPGFFPEIKRNSDSNT